MRIVYVAADKPPLKDPVPFPPTPYYMFELENEEDTVGTLTAVNFFGLTYKKEQVPLSMTITGVFEPEKYSDEYYQLFKDFVDLKSGIEEMMGLNNLNEEGVKRQNQFFEERDPPLQRLAKFLEIDVVTYKIHRKRPPLNTAIITP